MPYIKESTVIKALKKAHISKDERALFIDYYINTHYAFYRTHQVAQWHLTNKVGFIKNYEYVKKYPDFYWYSNELLKLVNKPIEEIAERIFSVTSQLKDQCVFISKLERCVCFGK